MAVEIWGPFLHLQNASNDSVSFQTPCWLKMLGTIEQSSVHRLRFTVISHSDVFFRNPNAHWSPSQHNPFSASSPETILTCVDWKTTLVCCTQRWAGQVSLSSPNWLVICHYWMKLPVTFLAQGQQGQLEVLYRRKGNAEK